MFDFERIVINVQGDTKAAFRIWWQYYKEDRREHLKDLEALGYGDDLTKWSRQRMQRTRGRVLGLLTALQIMRKNLKINQGIFYDLDEIDTLLKKEKI